MPATLLTLALRLFPLSRPGYLSGDTQYDHGVYFGNALRLVHGAIAYRDSAMVQPPGSMLLMAPIAIKIWAFAPAVRPRLRLAGITGLTGLASFTGGGSFRLGPTVAVAVAISLLIAVAWVLALRAGRADRVGDGSGLTPLDRYVLLGAVASAEKVMSRAAVSMGALKKMASQTTNRTRWLSRKGVHDRGDAGREG